MAELVVCAATGALEPLMEKLAAAVGEEYKHLKGVRREVGSLTKELEAMHAYLLKMSEVENPDARDRVCTKEVQELSYDMEDCLDEFLLRLGGKSINNSTPDGLIPRLKNIIVTKPNARRQIAEVIGRLKIQVKEMGERNARYRHYRSRLLPRVPNALGEGAATLGEAFPECNTRGRASEDASHGKEAFPESQKSCTRGSLPRVPS
jgi:disease resistance protein RPM1